MHGNEMQGRQREHEKKTADTQMIFNNTYDAKNSTTFTGTKSVEGGIRKPQSGQFKFGIYEKVNNEYVALDKDGKYETTNNGNVVTFPSIEYKLADLEGESSKTFTYYLHEIEPADNDKLTGYTYDPEYYEVTVTVSDKGDGTLDIQKSESATATEFKNKYEAEGEITIQATKSLIGGDTNTNYNFKVKMTPLTPGDTNTADIQTINVKGGGSATVKFNTLKYTKLGTYQYLVEEVTEEVGKISENIILNYDGNNVTFCYNSHVDNSYHEVTVTASEFITILLRHLLPSNFKIIRYFGFYRKKHPLHDKMFMMVSSETKKIRKQILNYTLSIQNFFKYNPFDCPNCGKTMIKICWIFGG